MRSCHALTGIFFISLVTILDGAKAELEESTKDVSCDENQFQCEDLTGVHSVCIPNTWVCDDQRDCLNGKDELNCNAKTQKCPDNNFQCNNGNCIFKNWKCDGEEDCSDGSDELLTEPSHCNAIVNQCLPGEMWKCGSGECIPLRWKCDSQVDCKDYSDERKCTSLQHTCKTAEFACKTVNKCINKSFVCDGEFDCSDGTDEDDCEGRRKECVKGEFTCPATFGAGLVRCIPESFRCDGKEDCPDGGDEKGCNATAPATCKEGVEVQCPSTPLQCLEMSKLCTSSRFDCGEGDKSVCGQNRHIEFCEPGSDGCICRKSYVEENNVCHCEEGYKLENGQCIDIDECDTRGACDHICLNTPGSYRCACHPGYHLSHGGSSSGVASRCRALGGDPLVLVTTRESIRQFDLVNKMYFPVSLKPVSAATMDFHIKNGTLFWSDVMKRQILSCRIGNATDLYLGTQICDKKHEVILDGDKIHTPYDLAVDWIHDLLFWTDSGLDQINVLDLNTRKQHVLFSSDLEQPRAISVDPELGLIFWTDLGKDARIERSGMDGQNRVIIIQGSLVIWPNTLALDYVDKRVYWADAKIKLIFSCDYWGKDIRTVLRSHQFLRHPFSMAIFENKLYYTDRQHDGVISVNKFTGTDLQNVMTEVKSPRTIRIYHQQAQPQLMENKCLESACEYMCLPRAVYKEASRGFEKALHDRPFSCVNEVNYESKSGFWMFATFLVLCVGGVVAVGFVMVRRKMGARSFTVFNFDNRRTTENPLRDPLAEPASNKSRNDGQKNL
ncbi:unnamed protein product [Caenorhabditis nigoni]